MKQTLTIPGKSNRKADGLRADIIGTWQFQKNGAAKHPLYHYKTIGAKPKAGPGERVEIAFHPSKPYVGVYADGRMAWIDLKHPNASTDSAIKMTFFAMKNGLLGDLTSKVSISYSERKTSTE